MSNRRLGRHARDVIRAVDGVEHAYGALGTALGALADVGLDTVGTEWVIAYGRLAADFAEIGAGNGSNLLPELRQMALRLLAALRDSGPRAAVTALSPAK